MRLLLFQQVRQRTGVHDFSAVFPRAWTDVDDPVGSVDRVLVVFDNDQSVPDVPQANECFNQATIVTLVKTDGWFVEDVENSSESRTDLRCEPNSLSFSARECSGCAGHCEVTQPDMKQELQTRRDFAQHCRRDLRITIGQGQRGHEVVSRL